MCVTYVHTLNQMEDVVDFHVVNIKSRSWLMGFED